MRKKNFKSVVNLLVCLSMMIMPITQAQAVQDTVVSPLLKTGAKGDAVKDVQLLLNELGYYYDAIDGIFGSRTKAAIVSFQLDCNLAADGVIGQETVEALKRIRANPQASRAGVNQLGYRIASFAKSFLDVPYAWAGRSPSGFDCSGFVYYLYDQFGMSLPRMADEQFATGRWVNRRNLQPGDLVFFSTYEPGPSHVGVYIGADQFIHASSGAGCVTITSLNKPYYFERYLGARRIIN